MDEYAVMFGTEPYFARLLFIIFSTLVCVIALNALIAFMTESFNKVQERKAPEFVRQRAGLLTELIVLEHATTEERRADEKRFAWIHCLAPISIIKTSESKDEQIVQKLDSIERKQQDMMSEHTRLMWDQQDGLKAIRAALGPARESEVSRQRLDQLEEKIDVASKETSQRLVQLEGEIEKRFNQFEEKIQRCLTPLSTRDPISTAPDAPRAGVRRETTPTSPPLLGSLPDHVRQELDKIRSDRESGLGQLEAAQSKKETLIKWCVPKHGRMFLLMFESLSVCC